MKKTSFRHFAAVILPWCMLAGFVLGAVLLTVVFWRDLCFVAKIRQSFVLIDRHYIEEVADDTLQDAALWGMTMALEDPYAAYYDEDAFSKKQETHSGSMVGIGITVQGEEDGSFRVVEVFEGSPAEDGGLLAGDFLLGVDETSFAGLDRDEALSLISGENGTTVDLLVRRGEEELVLSFERRAFEVPSVRLRWIGKTAYLRIQTFNHQTDDQFLKAIETIRAEGGEAVIFDLRGNIGGLLEPTYTMLDALVPEGVIAKQMTEKGTTVLAESDAEFLDLPMAVLTDSQTASSSELFASVLRDYEMAVLVGTNTYGKGVMQTTYPLGDGTAIKFTTAYFAPPNGEHFNGVGLTPDIEVISPEDAALWGDADTDPVLSAALALF